MKYEWGNGKVTKIVLRAASRASCAILLFILHTSYFILSAHAQQTNHPAPDSLCDCGGPALHAAPTNAGTDFLLCFEENTDPYFSSVYSANAYLGIYFASLGDADTVTITCNRYPAMQKVFVLQPNQSFTYDISDDTVREPLGAIDTMRDLWIVSDESVDDRVVQVHSNNPIVCYGLDYKRWSADAFCALPLEFSGTEYRVMSYGSSSSGVVGGSASSEFAVAAFEDNTSITITPAALSANNTPGGAPEYFTLQKGQCIQIQADTPNQTNGRAHLDLTGSIVTSNNKIAVYGGNVQTEIPDGFVRAKDQFYTRDMLLEAMPPTSAWGNSFVLEPITLDDTGGINPEGDLMRVLSLDTANVFVNGEPWITLKPGQFADSLITTSTLVASTTGPLLVAEMAHSSYTYYGPGDPFMAIIPPMEQTYNNYTFFLPPNPQFLPPDTGFSYQSVIVATDVNAQNSILLDGTLLSSSQFIPVPSSANGRTFSICQIRTKDGFNGLQPGVHTISTVFPATQGFTILGYGVGFANAYGYAAGQLLVPKRAIMIEYPPETTHSNTLNFHNTAYQPAYLDSAIFVPDNAKDGAFGIHSQEDVGSDIGRMDIGTSAQIHLVPNVPLIWPISGTVKIYSHLPSYWGIEPGTMHVTMYPNASADVSQPEASAISVTATPNPFSSFTTINFSIPESGDVTIALFDELGRVVRQIVSSEFSSGPYSIRIDRLGLPNGVYTCVVTSKHLNLHARIPIVAIE